MMMAPLGSQGCFARKAQSSPSPLAGEGWGGGYPQVAALVTPTPDPSPQGGGEKGVRARGDDVERCACPCRD
jgi:hypothetical protein